jgi:hypothetical protein
MWFVYRWIYKFMYDKRLSTTATISLFAVLVGLMGYRLYKRKQESEFFGWKM